MAQQAGVLSNVFDGRADRSAPQPTAAFGLEAHDVGLHPRAALADGQIGAAVRDEG